MATDNEYYHFDPVTLEIQDFDVDGFVLDIGGGGEGVIGRLKGKEVVAIDIRKDELEEAVDGPLKIVMDARDLKFLDGSFGGVTAFFSLMYMPNRTDHQQVLAEVFRILKPGGRLQIWEIDLAERPETDKDVFVVFLRYRVGDDEIGTGYGARWPTEPRGAEYYISLAEEAGFRYLDMERSAHIFQLRFEK